MTERIAKEDIVRVNEHGQNVVVVPKGQPIPEGVEESKTEDKAVRGSRQRKK